MATSINRFLSKAAGKGVSALDAASNRLEQSRSVSHISKQSFRLPSVMHGVPTVHIGKDIPRDSMESLDEAMGRMADKYPEAHRALNDVLLYNTPQGKLPMAHGIDFAQLPKVWQSQPMMQMAGGLTTLHPIFGLEDNPYGFHIALNHSVMTANKYLPVGSQATAIGQRSDTAMGQLWTHEFMHGVQNQMIGSAVFDSIHNHGLPMVSEAAIIKRAQEVTPDVFARINQPIIDALANRSWKGGQGILDAAGDLNPKATGALLGSKYAGSIPAELAPEVNVLRHYGGEQYTPELESAMQNVDAQYKAAMINRRPPPNIAPQPPPAPMTIPMSSQELIESMIKNYHDANPTSTGSSVRNGLRPRSRSAMGGIAYLG